MDEDHVGVRLPHSLKYLFAKAVRHRNWLTTGPSWSVLLNMLACGARYALGCKRAHTVPPWLKIDLSPLCNLRCTVCIHARPGEDPYLQRQRFGPQMQMPLERFGELMGQLTGRAKCVSLHYLGDPLMYNHLEEACALSRRAGLYTHIGTNFSFDLSDERLANLAASGLSHITVCIDGMSQEMYARTRAGGDLERVKDNLRRLCRIKRRRGWRLPYVEVQYIKFQHNLAHLAEAAEFAAAIGADQFTQLWGNLGNYSDLMPGRYRLLGPRSRTWLPRCPWPWVLMVVKYDGDVIPCCAYRHAAQYADAGQARVLGNVFRKSVAAVWRGRAYQELRRVCAHPGLFEREPALAATFCHGCPRLFHTEGVVYLDGRRHRYEDVYDLDEFGRPARRRVPAPTCPATGEAGVPAQGERT